MRLCTMTTLLLVQAIAAVVNMDQMAPPEQEEVLLPDSNSVFTRAKFVLTDDLRMSSYSCKRRTTHSSFPTGMSTRSSQFPRTTTFWKDWCNFIETGGSVSKNRYETPQSSGFRSKPKRVMKKILKKSGRYHFLRLHIFCPINLLGQKIWGSAHPFSLGFDHAKVRFTGH